MVLGLPVGRTESGYPRCGYGLSTWLIVPVIDIPLSLLGQAKAYDCAMVAISNTTKLLAAYLGGMAALKYVLRMRRVSSE